MKVPADSSDEYTVIARGCRREIRVQGSRFIADVLPVADAHDANRALDAIRREFHDATHHCFAYRIGPAESRSADDGEPSGTAGRPILTAIEGEGLLGTMVVVTRYFGGVKLGTGNLARAYAEAARAALAGAARETRFAMETFRLTFDHSLTGLVMNLLGRTGAAVRNSVYDEAVHLTVEVRRSRSAELRELLIEQSGGKVKQEAGEAPATEDDK